MQKYLCTLAIALSAIQTTWSRFIDLPCDSPHLQENFDVNQYTGLWYEIFRDEQMIFEKGATCDTAFYAGKPDGTIQVYNSQIEGTKTERDFKEGSAKCDGALCSVKFFLTYSGDYRVVATDYTEYSLVYSCVDSFLGKSDVNLWLLSRNPTIESATVESLKQTILKELPNYDQTWLHYTVQGETCNYNGSIPPSTQ